MKTFARAARCELVVIERALDQYERYVDLGNGMADAASIARLHQRRS